MDTIHLKKTEIDGTFLEDIVRRHATGATKTGNPAKSYTLTNITAILQEAEDAVLAVHMEDLPELVRFRNFFELVGYAGYTTGKDEDRPKLYIIDCFPVKRKRDGKQFGYVVRTRSIGSGIEARFTIFNNVYDRCPIRKDDIIYCTKYRKDGAYYTMTEYYKISQGGQVI